MRVVVIADIHGNLAALEAVLEEIGRLRPDRLIVAGDIVDGGPDSAACWERVKTLGCPVLRGNHERYVFDFGTERAAPEWVKPQFGPLHFARSELSERQMREMAALPTVWRDPALPGLVVVHASELGDHDSVLTYTPDDVVEALFPTIREPLIVRGHNHQCMTREWRHGRIVTTGAVGMPQDGNPSAQFAVFESGAHGWSARHRSVRYDVGATLRRFHESGYLEKSGPLGGLFYREVETATMQVVPFLRFWGTASMARPDLSLEAAVAEWLRR
ncbi:metallophosphoesterase [Opitutaceae bacterium TAV4]|nr:metallophosphoesterase [Opitutaceae bacterium TAV4]RRJ99281.1 metallophosphoesterase [Opitutaceae bacterium TAV3]